MKFLKYALIVIGAIALLFFGKGLLTPTISYESEITVNKSIEESWGVMSDESKISEWLTSITKIEPVSGVPNTVGAVSNVYAMEEGEEIIMQETITDIKENEYMAMTFTMDFMNMDYEISLKEVNGKTKITTKSVTKGNGIFAKSILSFLEGTMKAQEDENMNNLKKVIEENTKVY